jgi:hypothetical protein
VESYTAGQQYAPLGGIGLDVDSRIPGSGPFGILHRTVEAKAAFGDDPRNPRDPDRTRESCGTSPAQAETRLRFVPSGIAREILLDAYARPASFMRGMTDVNERLTRAYATEIAKWDTNKDGVLQFTEVDIDASSNGQPNTRLYLAPSAFNRIAITREINDGMLGPRFVPSAQAYVLAGDGTVMNVKR